MAAYPPRPRRHAHHPMIRWSSLATGSLVGIGTWALAYVFGATIALGCGIDVGDMELTSRIVMGIYGAVSASLALAVAAYTAARTGGVRSREDAVLYGLCLWSMSTITLVVVTCLTGLGYIGASTVQGAPIFAVGLAAVGALPKELQPASAATLAAVLATLLCSLGIALLGSLRAHQPPTS